MEDQEFLVKCPQCGTINAEKSNFCRNCGESFQSVENQVTCPECGNLNPENSNFCRDCGTSLQSVENKIKCPACGMVNRSGSVFCAVCGENLSGKRISEKKGRKVTRKLYEDSKGAIRSARAKGIRKTAKEETKHLVRGIDDLTDGRISKTLDSPGKYGYLVCDNCHKYYPLKKGVNPEDFKVCTCGGKLSFYKTSPLEEV